MIAPRLDIPRAEEPVMNPCPWSALLLAATLGLALPGAQAMPAGAAKGVVVGQVLEVKQAGAYTYLRLKTNEGETWAAVSAAQVVPGALVRIANPTVMEKFESRSLQRSFDKIVFGSLEAPGAAGAPGGAAPAMTRPTPGAGGAQAAVPAPVKVSRAQGPEGRTVAEVVGGRAGLKDKRVVVRGQVVKVNQGIMGKNWLHLRDGSGSDADGSNDLLVTTRDIAAVGDIVAASGTVRVDVKLGSGYGYAVLVEDAALKK
jgi:hypothetical protein